MLPGDVEIRLGHSLGHEQAVVLEAAGLAQLLEAFGAQYLAERIRRVDGAVDQDVGHVDALRRKLGVERLA